MNEEPKDLFEWSESKSSESPEKEVLVTEFRYASPDDGYGWNTPHEELEGRTLSHEKKNNNQVLETNLYTTEEKSPEEIEAENAAIDREVEIQRIQAELEKPLAPQEATVLLKKIRQELEKGDTQ